MNDFTTLNTAVDLTEAKPPCPTCSKPGQFLPMGQIGDDGKAWARYECPNKHTWKYSPSKAD